ncbi:MAG: hypothetical protein V3R16_09565 [Nitrospirales bacterium]
MITGFIVGLVVGATIGATAGILLMSMFMAGKLSDLDDKIALLERQLGSDPSSKFYPAALLFPKRHN